MEKKEKKERNFSFAALIVILAVILFVGSIVFLIVYGCTTRDEVIGRDGCAVISLDGYTDTIYFTEKYKEGHFYIFILYDGTEVRCHRHNVVIYYDEENE